MAGQGLTPENREDAAGQPPARRLPGHIEAALAGAGGATDSAGQPWAGRSLSGEDAKIHNFEDDDGTADSAYLAAIDARVIANSAFGWTTCAAVLNTIAVEHSQ